MRLLFFYLISLVLISACKETEMPELVLPSDLKVEIMYDSSSGAIEVSATAKQANFYSFQFHDVESIHETESIEGFAEYLFSKSGTFEVIVRAHATSLDFIEFKDSVEVTVPTENNSNSIPLTGYSSPLSYDGYDLVWNDEFDGSTLNPSNWNYELGTGVNGWGNAELQYYLRENVTVNDGYLTITAKKQTVNTSLYTSSRITTQAKKEFKYGRVDIRAALPQGQGIWPALWMLGSNFNSMGWPQCGEIDIMEMVGGDNNNDRTVHGTAHWSQSGSHASHTGSTLAQEKLSKEFHVYSVIWDENSIKWYFDDQQYHTLDITSADLSEFHENFFFIMNIAVGGNWPGNPNSTTEFPQYMHVDYIRVFQ